MSQPHTVILIGAGHVHLYVAAHAETLIERGARVVLVDPDGFWYSGLATGMLGGMYESAEDRVAPQALLEAHGGEFIQDRVETVDAGARRLRLADGGDLAYDYLSINVGSRVNVDALPGAAHDPTVWSVKPICNLWQLRVPACVGFAGRGSPRTAPGARPRRGGPGQAGTRSSRSAPNVRSSATGQSGRGRSRPRTPTGSKTDEKLDAPSRG